MVGSFDRGANRAPAGSRALDPSEFSFTGFGDLTRDELRKILRLGIRNGSPNLTVVDDALYIPSGFETGPDQPKYAGGVIQANGQPIESALTHRKGGKRFGGLVAPVDVTPEEFVDEEVVYLGLLFNHYGRVLLESLARVWYVSEASPDARFVFTGVNSAQAAQAPWLPHLLEVFGIPAERVLHLTRPARLRRAIVPEPLFEQFHSAHEAMIEPFRDVAGRVAAEVTVSDQPLYLSRTRLSSRQRPVVGEAELEALLLQNEFRIAYPETMTIGDQVRLVNQHRDIFASIGSAAHNVLFACQQPQLHLLVSRDDVPANYYLCSALAEAPTTFVNCLGSGGRTTPNDERLARREGTRAGGARRVADPDAGPQSMPQLLDLQAARAYLRQRGLLKRDVEPPGEDVTARLQREFDEAWLYARLRKSTGKATELPPDLEVEAAEMSAHSWPVSLMLARFHARARNEARTDEVVQQLSSLLSQETDIARVAYYRGDMEGLAPRVARYCLPGTAERFAAVVGDQLAAISGELAVAREW